MKDNLKEERLMILEMVREGQITSDDATKLLGSLQTNSFIDASRVKEYFDNEEIEEKFSKFYNNVDSFAKDLKLKLDNAYRGVEPKVKSTTKKAMQKIANKMEDLSKNINESIENMETKQDNENCECSTDNCRNVENDNENNHQNF